MNNQELEELEMQVREAQVKAGQAQTQVIQQDLYEQNQEKGMISEQLNLGEELDRIDYLLRGYTIERDEQTGASSWVKPKENNLIVLSDYGVHLIRNTIAWYLNKNTLLSNYDEETIRNKMEDFATSLNDKMFMAYEKVFLLPTIEDCEKIWEERIRRKIKERNFTYKILGQKEPDGEEVRKQILKETIYNNGLFKIQESEYIFGGKELTPEDFYLIDTAVKRELDKIREQETKIKLTGFEIIMREVQDAVHSTYLRAFAGQERKTLREHIHISETKGGVMIPNQKEERKLFRRR